VKVSDSGLNLIKKSEALRLLAYADTGAVPTIGWGHTRGVTLGLAITREQAEAFLREDVRDAEREVNRLVYVPLTQNQFDALVDFVFNIGGFKFERSTLLRMLNKKDYLGAANQFPRWVYDSKKVKQPGLVIRRDREKELFNG
jgi:lysozyme